MMWTDSNTESGVVRVMLFRERQTTLAVCLFKEAA